MVANKNLDDKNEEKGKKNPLEPNCHKLSVTLPTMMQKLTFDHLTTSHVLLESCKHLSHVDTCIAHAGLFDLSIYSVLFL